MLPVTSTSTLVCDMLVSKSACRRLDQLLKRYQRGELRAVDWLDPLALKRIEQLRYEVAFDRAFWHLNQNPPPLPPQTPSSASCPPGINRNPALQPYPTPSSERKTAVLPLHSHAANAHGCSDRPEVAS